MKWLLKLYPPAWRRRYEAEMAALLEVEKTGRRTFLDLLRGAADAWAIGPRGPLGGLAVWLGAAVYFVASFGLGRVYRSLAPLGEPLDMLYEAASWAMFALFITWMASQPAARCDLGRIGRFLRRRTAP
jgi:hypothetical protein